MVAQPAKITPYTPTELINARTERTNAVNAKRAAEDKLAEEQDPNKSGSLAHQLAAATATPATPADMVPKSEVAPLAKKAKTLAAALKGPAGTKVSGKDDVVAEIDKIVAKVS